MARRRKGRRRHRGNQHPDHRNDYDAAQRFNHTRRAMQQELAQQEERRQALNSNVVLRKASEAAAKECRAYVGNVPNTATAMALAQYLGSNLGGRVDGVLRVEMHRRGARAWARVTLAGKDILDTLMARALYMSGRNLKCSLDSRGASSDRRLETFTTMIPTRRLILRKNHAGACTKPLATAAFTTTQDVLLELNASRNLQLVVEFGAFRIEFSLGMVKRHALFKIRTASGGIDSLCLRLVLSRPPLCYSFVQDTSAISGFASLTSMLLSGVNKNPMIWDRNPDACLGRNGTGYWDRTTDPSSGSAFGHCLIYDLVIDQQHGSELAQKMHELSMFRTTPIWISEALLRPHIGQLEAHDWSGGFDGVFDQVLFSIRYLLHANIAAHKLVFESLADAQRVCSVLRQCDLEHATNALTDVYLSVPEAHSVEVLLRWLNEPQDEEDFDDEENPAPTLPESTCLTRRILVTPLRVCPQLPEMDMSNRILRQYAAHNERFVRVTFVDENFGSILQARSNHVFDRRIRSLLRNGIMVAGNKFVFLAFSNSQLREQSAWFYNETPTTVQVPSANEIRASMGDLSSILIVGKYASRLGQGFSSTTNVTKIPPARVSTMGDVQRHGFTFSDGVGVMSRRVAESAAHTLQLDYLPSALQIRFGGSKGVVSLCPPGVPMRYGKELLLRSSMTKFAGNPEHHDLEICSVAKAMPCYLNRQAITVLTAMRVPANSFLNLMYRMIQTMQSVTSSNVNARSFLRLHASHSIVNRLLDAGFPIKTDRFMREWVGAVRSRLLLDLRLKARICVPQGIMLMGIMDETQMLAPDQVFFQVRDPKRINIPVKGSLLAVGRNPCLHPGDIRLLKMVDASMFPRLEGLFDVLVFSAQGDRPQPNMMSGGDLDGDLYFAIWDPSIVGFAHEYPPMEYNAPPAPMGISLVTNDQVQDFFVSYIKNDNLGVIANAHVAFADVNEDGARSQECLQLAALHSTAVDFCKTGIPAEMPRSLKAAAYPHFMENSFKASYESKKVLGQIFDIAKHAEMNSSGGGGKNGVQSTQVTSSDPVVSNGFDACLLFPGYERYVDHAWTTLDEYMWGLWDIACVYGVFDEAQLVSGFASKFSRKVSRQKGQKGDANSAGERMDIAVRALQQIYKSEFWEEFEPIDRDGFFSDDVLAKASAWYFCAYTYSDDSGYAPYLSFAWLATKPMCQLRTRVYGVTATR